MCLLLSILGCNLLSWLVAKKIMGLFSCLWTNIPCTFKVLNFGPVYQFGLIPIRYRKIDSDDTVLQDLHRTVQIGNLGRFRLKFKILCTFTTIVYWCLQILYFQETNRLEYLIPKKTNLRYRLPMADQGFVDFVTHVLEINPKKRPNASEALRHPWLSYPYEPISSWISMHGGSISL